MLGKKGHTLMTTLSTYRSEQKTFIRNQPCPVHYFFIRYKLLTFCNSGYVLDLQITRQKFPQLPVEPPHDVAACAVKIRCPDGSHLHRRIAMDQQLSDIFLYIATEGYNEQSWDLFTTFPLKNVCFHNITYYCSDII